MFLTNLGYEPESVETGQECLDAGVRSSYDVILVSLDMPEMSGMECISELRRLQLDNFLIAVSSKHAARGRVFSRQAGANNFLAKPFDGKELKPVLLDAFATVKEWSAAFSRVRPRHRRAARRSQEFEQQIAVSCHFVSFLTLTENGLDRYRIAIADVT